MEFPKFAWGDLNLVRQKSFGPRLDPQILPDITKVLTDKLYSSNSISKRTEWIGIVLRVETDSNEPNSFLDTSNDPNNPIDTKGITRARIKVRVPELHASIPEPMSYVDHFIIDMHPTFSALDCSLPIPDIGDRVVVGYSDPDNLVDPIYKDYIECKQIIRTGGGGSKSARNCIEFTPGKGCFEQKPVANSKINMKNFPAPKGSLLPKASNSSVFMFGDSQMQGKFGKVFEEYLKFHAWNTKRFARSGSKSLHWLTSGRNKEKRELKEFLSQGLSTNPHLIIISLGGNERGVSKEAIRANVKKIAKKCLISSTSCTVIWSGCPPTVKNTKPKIFSDDRHNWNEPGPFSYRENVNVTIGETLKTEFPDEYEKRLFFINPIGTKADGYKGKTTFLPSYQAEGGDGVHLTLKAAKEYVKNIVKQGFGEKELQKSQSSDPPGVSPSEPVGSSIDPTAELARLKKLLKNQLALQEKAPCPEGEECRDQNLVDKYEEEIKKYEKMPKALSAKGRTGQTKKMHALQQELENKNLEIADGIDAGTNVITLQAEAEKLMEEIKAIEDLLKEDDQATAQVPCSPCAPGTDAVGSKWNTDPLGLGYKTAQAKNWVNGTNKYLRAFLRMLAIGEGGGRTRAGISPYSLIVGGKFKAYRDINDDHDITTNPSEVPHWGGKFPGKNYGNFTTDTSIGHPRIRCTWHKSGSHSSAAGRYQFLVKTWYEWVAKYSPGNKDDFTPAGQDIIVLNYLAKKGIKDLLELGGDNFITPAHVGSKTINEGRDPRPPRGSIIMKDTRKNLRKGVPNPNYGIVLRVAHPNNKFEEQFYRAVDKVRNIWASLPGSPYKNQQTKKSSSVFLDYYKVTLADEIELEKAAGLGQSDETVPAAPAMETSPETPPAAPA